MSWDRSRTVMRSIFSFHSSCSRASTLEAPWTCVGFVRGDRWRRSTRVSFWLSAFVPSKDLCGYVRGRCLVRRGSSRSSFVGSVRSHLHLPGRPRDRGSRPIPWVFHAARSRCILLRFRSKYSGWFPVPLCPILSHHHDPRPWATPHRHVPRMSCNLGEGFATPTPGPSPSIPFRSNRGMGWGHDPFHPPLDGLGSPGVPKSIGQPRDMGKDPEGMGIRGGGDPRRKGGGRRREHGTRVDRRRTSRGTPTPACGRMEGREGVHEMPRNLGEGSEGMRREKQPSQWKEREEEPHTNAAKHPGRAPWRQDRQSRGDETRRDRSVRLSMGQDARRKTTAPTAS
eukprot:scaffold60_cov325-Pavlova_lutheri.AAC.19